MSVGMPATPAAAPEWGKTSENNPENAAEVQSAGGISTIEVGRRVFSSVLGFVFSPISLLARKVACTEPVASFFLQRYVQNKQPENVQWMVDQGKTFDKRHDQCIRMASENQDSDTVKLLLQHGTPELMESYMQDSPEAFRKVVSECDMKLGNEHHSLLSTAASDGDVETLEVLLNHGTPVVLELGRDCEPIFEAVKGGHCDALKVLVEHGAPANGGSFWSCGDLLNEAFKVEDNQDEIVEILLQTDIFSAETGGKACPDDDPVTKEDVQSARKTALSDALLAECSDHVLCLLLIEVGDSRLEDPELTDEKCKSIYEAGLKSGDLEASEDAETSDDFKDMLKSTVLKAHNKLEATRLEKLQF